MKAGVDDTNQFDELVSFITTFARAEQRYGSTSYETELFIRSVIRKLGLHSETWFATPKMMQIALWKDDESRQTMHLAVTKESGYDLNKISRIQQVIKEVIDGEISIGQGLEQLNNIDRAPPTYGKPLSALAFVLCGFGFAVMLGFSWLDVLFGGLLSLVSFGVTHLASHAARATIVMELLAAALAGFFATVITVLVPGLNPLGITLCAVLYFIPGFGLTTAPREIIYGNTLLGVVRLTDAVVIALKLFSGAIMGVAFAQNLVKVPVQKLFPPVEPIWTWAFVPIMMMGLALLFKVAPRNLAVIFIGGLLVWAGVQVGNTFGYWQGSFLGAVVLAVFAKLCGTRLRIPSAAISLPLVMILVPGYEFLAALYAAQYGGLDIGVSALFKVASVVIIIIAGMFVGDSIVSADFSKLGAEISKIGIGSEVDREALKE